MRLKDTEFDDSEHLRSAVVLRYRDRPLPWRVAALLMLLGSALFYAAGYSLLALAL